MFQQLVFTQPKRWVQQVRLVLIGWVVLLAQSGAQTQPVATPQPPAQQAPARGRAYSTAPPPQVPQPAARHNTATPAPVAPAGRTPPVATSVKVGKLKYSGGGDWYANPTSLPNLFDFIKLNTRINIGLEEEVVEAGSAQVYQYPLIYLTGHGNITFSDQEISNLRAYLRAGGFLFADDNYGLNRYITREIKRLFPDQALVEVPFTHPVYHQQWEFATGLPKIHAHDGKPAQGFGIFIDGRLAVFLTFECDLGDGWEDRTVHNNTEELRQKAFQMGTNVLLYVLTK
jgi:Domain of unknown function (DUF4159)